MAARRLTFRGIEALRAGTRFRAPSCSSTSLLRATSAPLLQSHDIISLHLRPLHYTHRQLAAANEPVIPLKNAPPNAVPDSHDPDQDQSKHAAYLGEADSNDGHDAYQDAHGDPPASLDARNSAYLGEADSDDGFEHNRDVDGRPDDPVDASQSAYLGEADSDDGFEGRRAAHPEEAVHDISDPNVSGFHGESGEGDGINEHDEERHRARRERRQRKL